MENKLVLVIDDTEVIRELFEGILEAMNHQSILASDGPQGIYEYESRKKEIDLVILDFTMPGMNGDEVFSKLKEINPDIKVILATAHQPDSEEWKTILPLIQKGCFYLHKPFDLERFKAVITTALG